MAAYQKKIYQQTLSNARSNQSFLFRNHRTALCRKNKIYMCLSVYFFNPFLVCLIFHYRIRYEERDLFPYLEQTIPPTALEDIGKKIAEIHHKEKDDFKDEFWLKDQ